jgi:hypothetical protein
VRGIIRPEPAMIERCSTVHSNGVACVKLGANLRRTQARLPKNEMFAVAPVKLVALGETKQIRMQRVDAF